MHVVMPDPGTPNTAPANGVKAAGDARNAAAAGGIFAALLAALQQAAVEVAPPDAPDLTLQANDGAESGAATETDSETEHDAAASVDGETAAEDPTLADAENATLIATVAATHAKVVLTSGAGEPGVASGPASTATEPTLPSRLHGTLFNATDGAITPAPTATGADTAPATASPPAAATPGQVVAVQETAAPDGAVPKVSVPSEGADVAVLTPSPGVVDATSAEGGSKPQQPSPTVLATNGATPNQKPALSATDSTTAITATAENPGDDATSANTPRFLTDEATNEEVNTGAKAASDAPLHARPADVAAVSADRAATITTAAPGGNVSADAQVSAAGVQTRSDGNVNAPPQPQAPEPPPRPTPTDLTQFAVKSVRYLAGRGEETMTVRLVPESLGELRLVVRSGEHSLDVQLSAVNAAVRDSLEQQLPALREALTRDAGDARQVNITINAGTDQQSAGSQFARHFAGASQFGEHPRHNQPELLHDLPRMPTRQTTHAGQLDVRA